MSDFLERIGKLSPKRLALLALEQQEQIEAAAHREHAPIAIIGMACRFPGGANDPESYWQLLREGRDAITDVPADRWDIDAYFDPDPDAAGRMSVRNGGFLAHAADFDPAFFGISPREALTMDPQQRLLLEVAWESLEHAGLSVERLSGSATGVFVGICNLDHFQRLLHRGTEFIDAYLASGNAHSVAAGRISYCLGLQGPAIAIDTACSSSLVALHVACQSVRSGESRVALAAGVNMMCAPETTIALSSGHMLAPDGRCKTFDASADGFARGEGCGVLVLKLLSEAQADNDRILAVIRGTAVNQDGRSGGLTVPNGPAQEAVIRAALHDASLAPLDIDYVEAHGTGTSLGDPIEVRALAGALGEARDAANPLLIGSVKTNIGHLESAAGIAGVIKVVLSMQHEFIPRHLHFREPSPHIPWASFPVRVTADGQPWVHNERVRRAGVSSFGFSGTNAHVILEEAPVRATPATEAATELHVLPLSARTSEALDQLVDRYTEFLSAQTSVPFANIAYTAGHGRSHHTERLAIVASSSDGALAELRAFRDGGAQEIEPSANIARGTAVPGQPPEVVFMFTGQGSQYAGMGRELYDSELVYRDVIDRCDEILGADERGRTLKGVLFGEGESGASIHETAWTQPALFAVEYGLAELWRSWGVEPAAVIGHSVGEYVAACVAGVFTLEDGLRLIAERGRLMQALPAGGAMAALFTSEADVTATIAPFADRVAIAAINARDSVVISGTTDAIDAVLAVFADRNVRGHRLLISLAGHSPLVEPALAAMQACASEIAMHAPRIPVAWNVTGGRALPGGAAPDAVYWRRHLREPVRFADGVASLHAMGYRHFLEVGPHPTLMALAQRTLDDDDTKWHASLRRGKDARREILASVAALYADGAAIQWDRVSGGSDVATTELPAYPFQHTTYWIPPIARNAAASFRAPVRADSVRALQGERLPVSVPLFEITLTPTSPAWLSEHRVHGAVLAPGPLFVALAQNAATKPGDTAPASVTRFSIRDALVVPPEGRTVQLHLAEQPDDEGTTEFSVRSRGVDDRSEWVLHATGNLRGTNSASNASIDLESIRARLGNSESGAVSYDALPALGVEMGPTFRSMSIVHRQDGESLVRIELAASLQGDGVRWAHPALLDGALQAVGVAVPRMANDAELYLLTGIDELVLAGALPPSLWCHAVLRDWNPSASVAPAEWLADVTLADEHGISLGVVRGVTLRRAPKASLERAIRAATAHTNADTAGVEDANDGLHYRVEWTPSTGAAPASLALRTPTDTRAAAFNAFERLAAEHDLAVYDRLLPELDAMCSLHVRTALEQLGFDRTRGRRFNVDEERELLCILPRHARLFARMLGMLAEDGVLRRADNAMLATFEVVEWRNVGDARARYAPLLEEFGAINGELRTLMRCGFALADALTGRQDGVALLFPNGSLAEARQLYVESPSARTYNGALATWLAETIAGLPANARLRVLEIGGGTGGTTTYLLPMLPADRVDYTFTDISPLFLDRAREQCAAFPFVQYQTLDIERVPERQGFALGTYDVVIAANVLHATASLATAVAHARALLAPDGQLMLLEGTTPERWVDLTFGLTDGWWRFTDTTLRPSYPLIARSEWVSLLASSGFDAIATVPGEATRGRAGSQQTLVVARAPGVKASHIIVGDLHGVGEALARKLRAQGAHVEQQAASEHVAEIASGATVVYLGALEIPAPNASPQADVAVEAESLSCLHPLRWLAQVTNAGTGGRVWLVTRGSQRILASDVITPLTAPLWGVARVFALEQPALWGGIVDLPDSVSADADADVLMASLLTPSADDQIGYRNGERYVARLERAPAATIAPARFQEDATYLITGGFGGLGSLLAHWMVANGARHLALLGRNALSDSNEVRAIEAMGATVHALAGDVADEHVMRAHFATLAATAPPVRGVMHAAAAFSSAPIVSLTPDEIRAMLRPKIDGTLVLERLTESLPLDFFVMFSSTTAILGAFGMAHYAAANAFLDATALARNSATRRVLSVNWGTWDAMRLASPDAQRTYRDSGLVPMPSAVALDVLGKAIASKEAQAIVAHIDWAVLKPLHEARRVRPLLTQMHGDAPAATLATTSRPSESGLALRLAGAPSGTHQEILVEFVQREVAAVLGIGNAGSVPVATGLFDLGMDSLMSVELKRRLERGSGRRLPSTLTFNYPHVEALAGFIGRELASAAASTAPAALEALPSTPSTTVSPATSANLDDLSDEDIEARLLSALADSL